MAHTVIPPPRGTTATLELTHKGNINDKTIPERDREVRDDGILGMGAPKLLQKKACQTSSGKRVTDFW